MWNTWTWAAEEFLLMELREDSTVKSTLRRHWPDPPVVKTDPRELDKWAEHAAHGDHYQLCTNKKPPSGVIQIMDAVKGALKQVLQYVRAHERADMTRLGKWLRGVQQCWLSTHRGLDQLRQEQPPPPPGGDNGASAR